MRQGTRRSGRPAQLAISVFGSVLALGGLGLVQNGATAPSAKSDTAAHRFKNIKVLKNMPADQLLPAMHNISESLGVRCDFCHVVNPDHTGFERDDKKAKTVARQMMVMVQDINAHQKVLDGKASCYMCHHGRPEPETKVPAGGMRGGPMGPGGPRRGPGGPGGRLPR